MNNPLNTLENQLDALIFNFEILSFVNPSELNEIEVPFDLQMSPEMARQNEPILRHSEQLIKEIQCDRNSWPRLFINLDFNLLSYTRQSSIANSYTDNTLKMFSIGPVNDQFFVIYSLLVFNILDLIAKKWQIIYYSSLNDEYCYEITRFFGKYGFELTANNFIKIKNACLPIKTASFFGSKLNSIICDSNPQNKAFFDTQDIELLQSKMFVLSETHYKEILKFEYMQKSSFECVQFPFEWDVIYQNEKTQKISPLNSMGSFINKIADRYYEGMLKYPFYGSKWNLNEIFKGFRKIFEGKKFFIVSENEAFVRICEYLIEQMGGTVSLIFMDDEINIYDRSSWKKENFGDKKFVYSAFLIDSFFSGKKMDEKDYEKSGRKN